MKHYRYNIVLIDPTEKQRLEREPLLAFSYYLSSQNNSLLFLSDEIIQKLNEGFNDGNHIDTSIIGKASFMMWLWTLGAYEVTRTISQAKGCFNPMFIEKIAELKKVLEIVRIPNAKMEKRRKTIPVNSNRSPDGWDIASKDLLVGDPDDYKSARQLIIFYNDTLCSLDISDVLKSHEESYL